MSAEAMGWTFRHSPYSGAKLAVHLAIADSVNDQHGNDLWITQGRLAAKARVSRDAANKAMQKLVADGFLELLEDNAARGRANRYRFVFNDGARVVYESRAVPKVAQGAVGDDTPQDPAVGGGAVGDDTPAAADDKATAEGVQSETTGVQSETAGGAVRDDTEPKRTQGQPNETSASPPVATRRDPIGIPTADGTVVTVDPNDADGSWAVFVDGYPRHRVNGRKLGGGAEKKARARWGRLKPAERALALAALANYRHDLMLTGDPVKHATTWLNQDCWDTYADPPDTTLPPVAVALAEACRADLSTLTGPARGELIAAAQAIASTGAGADAVGHVVGQWRKKWPDIQPGFVAVARNWHRFAGDVRGRPTGRLCPDCGQERDRHDAQLCQILGRS